ncbi:hypothetical protein [Endozoicomonas atrinae]|uniref:hypothetical protein n=1 Tax=Endozoicomonas atrinae TaxID=1333660 RepID=UPI000A7120CF|nr:hypothetical protein [Endozoicomonas atrinae]
MPRVNNPKLGTIACDLCGNPASVKQNAKQYLYVGCQDCGVDMRKGARLQTRLYRESQWLDGVTPKLPPNMIMDEEKPRDSYRDNPRDDSGEIPRDGSRETPRDDARENPIGSPREGTHKKGGLAILAGIAALILLPLKGGM